MSFDKLHLGDEEGGVDVEVDRLLDLVRGDVTEAGGQQDAGVVDHHIQLCGGYGSQENGGGLLKGYFPRGGGKYVDFVEDLTNNKRPC